VIGIVMNDEEKLNYFNGCPFMLSPTRGSVLVWNKEVKRWQDYECIDSEGICPGCHNTKLHIRAIKGTSYWGICSKCENSRRKRNDSTNTDAQESENL